MDVDTRRRAVCLLVCLGAGVPAAPAQAHPFGAPQNAQISADPATGTVTVRWNPSAADDLSFLAVGLGLAPSEHAFLAGAAHAVGPGHGKSLAAACLVGSQGRVRDAAWLGGSVAVMHTISVFVLAVAWTFFDLSGVVDLKQVTSALELVAGATVVLVGLWLLRRSMRPGGRAGSVRRPLTHRHGLGRPHAQVLVPAG